MSNLQRILKRKPDVDEAEIDDLRLLVLARLAAANRGAPDHPPTPDEEPAVVSPVDDDARAATPVRPVNPAVSHGPSPWMLVAPLEDAVEGSEASVPIAMPSAPSPIEPTAIETTPAVEARRPARPQAAASASRRTAPHTAAESPVIEAWPPAQPGFFALDEDAALEAPAPDAPVAIEPLVIGADAPAEVVDATEPEPVEADIEVAPRPRRARRPARAVPATRRPADDLEDASPISSTRPVPIEATAYCPYCASLLQPPPEASRRCPRCGQRILVRHVGARTVYLAEAVLPFFEAERRRAMESERKARERDRWLDLARESGAAASEVQSSAAEPLSEVSEADVAAARALYMSTVDRSFRIAKSDRRWEEAASVRYDQALVLFRIAGSPASPPDEVVKVHREGVAADLHAIGEVAKDAELRGASCCETCRVDEGRVVRIAEELRFPRLPHRGCPKGLCGCRWFLSARDQEFLSEFLRRQAGASRRFTAPPDGTVAG